MSIKTGYRFFPVKKPASSCSCKTNPCGCANGGGAVPDPTDVLGTLLTGFELNDGHQLSQTDTILSAFESLQQQINNIVSPPPQLWYDFTDTNHSVTIGLI